MPPLKKTILLPNETATQACAQDLAARLRPGDCLALVGDLGAGKTFFARAVIRAMMGDPAFEVPSPTFTLLQTYPAPLAEIWHYDWYRLEQPEELMELGWRDDPAARISLVEWPDRFAQEIPPHALGLRLESAGPEARRLTVEGDAAWSHRLQGWPEAA